MKTDWKQLAEQLGTFIGSAEISGDHFAQKALDEILGEEWIESTVEHSISFKPGRELAMNCLHLINSTKATNYAYYVYKTSVEERAEQAVCLIKHLTNPISIGWIEEFLNDNNVIHWGLSLLDQLLWTKKMPFDEQAKTLLNLADTNSDGKLKEHTDFIREYSEKRETS